MSASNAKFKVGDEVRRVRDVHMGMKPGDTATVMRVLSYNHVTLSGFDGEHSEDSLEPLAASPIRTVTRREIVPGVYGGVEVSEWASKPRIKFDAVYPSADHLREAAHLFNQLAEVLEEDSKAAA